jgi:hypothetical protein
MLVRGIASHCLFENQTLSRISPFESGSAICPAAGYGGMDPGERFKGLHRARLWRQPFDKSNSGFIQEYAGWIAVLIAHDPASGRICCLRGDVRQSQGQGIDPDSMPTFRSQDHRVLRRNPIQVCGYGRLAVRLLLQRYLELGFGSISLLKLLRHLKPVRFQSL